MLLTLVVGAVDSDAGTDAGKEGAEGNASSPVSFGAAMRRILMSEAAFSLAMILLFACLFTTMTSFQPTFAGARGLDYSVFYVAYTVAVIFSRFVLAGLAARFDSRLVIAGSVSVMALAVASFLAVGSNTLFYGISSAALGLGYGSRTAGRAGSGGQRLGGAGKAAGAADGGHALRRRDPRLPAGRRMDHHGLRVQGPVRGPPRVRAGTGRHRLVAFPRRWKGRQETQAA